MNARLEFRGTYITRLARDWRVHLLARFAACLPSGPLVLLLAADDPCLVVRPQLRAIRDFSHVSPRYYDLSLAHIGNRSRFTVPADLRCDLRRHGIKPGAELQILGQGHYFEVWSRRTFRAMLTSPFDGLLPPDHTKSWE